MKCYFCEHEGKTCDGVVVCTECQKWLRKHIGVICLGCESIYWVVRTPESEKYAEEMPEMAPIMVFKGNIVYSIRACKFCAGEAGNA